MKEEPSPRWPRQLGIGCLALLGLLVLLAAFSLVFVNVGGERSIRSREALDRALPPPETWTPPLDGGLDPARIRIFLTVRGALMEDCALFLPLQGSLDRMEGFEQMEKDPPVREFLLGVRDAAQGLWRVARQLNAHLIRRNHLLLTEGMGRGEYAWLYSLIYYSWLGHEPERFALAREEELAVYRGRVLPQLRAMVARRVEELEAAEPVGGRRAELALWSAENALLQGDPDRIPFAGSLPPAMAAALEPFRDRLEALYCPATSELDLTLTEREGIGFEHR